MRYFMLATIATVLLSSDDNINYRPKISTDIAKVLIAQSVDTPIPDDEPLSPHPDASKCICKGTGVIVQGDGHKTVCPYHGSKKDEGCTSETCTGNCEDNCRCKSGCSHDSVKEKSVIKLISHNEPKDEAVKESSEYILYVFSAKWCGPCQAMKRNVWDKRHKDVHNFLKERDVELHILDYDKSEHKKYFSYYNVKSFPRTILVRRDKVQKQIFHIKGGQSKTSILQSIRKGTEKK